MKFRKLIEFGKSSYVMSIPKNWVVKYELKKGDLLFLNETEEGLLICPKETKKVKELKKTTIFADNKDKYMIQAEIISAYQANYGLIEVIGKDLKKHGKVLKDVFHNLSGLELMEQTDSKLVAKDLLKMEEVSVDALIRRIDIILRSMLKDSMNSVFEDYYESINTRDFDINRLVFLTRKILRSAMDNHLVTSQLNLDNRSLLKNWQTVSLLESVGDEVKRISRFFKEMDPKSRSLKELKKINKLMCQKYFDVMKAYHTHNKNSAFEIDMSYRKRMNDCDKVLRKENDLKTIKIIFHLKAVNNLIKNLARTIMDYDFEKR